MKKSVNLLNLSAEMMAENEMNDVLGGKKAPVACGPSNCKSDVHTSVNNALDNMRKNNPPVVEFPRE